MFPEAPTATNTPEPDEEEEEELSDESSEVLSDESSEESSEVLSDESSEDEVLEEVLEEVFEELSSAHDEAINAILTIRTNQEVRLFILLLNIEIVEEAALEMARRARGTPRVANRMLKRCRDFADLQTSGVISLPLVQDSLEKLGVDLEGLDSMDRMILETIILEFNGGPVGLGTLAAAVTEEKDTLEEVYEPFLLVKGFLQRTPRGRVATSHAYEHLKVSRSHKNPQMPLF